MFTGSQIAQLLAPLFAIQLIMMLIALNVWMRGDDTRYLPKWAWALIIIFVSTIGPILFLIFGREKDE